MKKYTVNELREMFLTFFEGKGHLRMKSFSLVPHNDDSLLIINSGMAPLKPYFTGQEIPPRRRVTTCQKCVRTGDLENVGKTARHGTFFEMLGNFSFGDYFKNEAIPWAWEFLTEVVGLDPDRLYPSVYVDDYEAFRIWTDKMHIPAERIIKLGKEDNFWEHGSGPCGPCTEIYYDRGEKYGNGPEDVLGGEGDRYMEVWNVVFSQFNNDGHGNYSDLVQKNIDTGMGLERLAVAVQDVNSIFDVDSIKAIRDEVCRIAGGIGYEKPDTSESDVSVRVITDHIRSATFMISDGIMPSNEGRGYVLRRIIRRAVRHGRKLGILGSFLPELSEYVIAGSKDGYPELEEKKAFILNVIKQEEDKFEKTFEQGLDILDSMKKDLASSGSDTLSGSDAFKLYDTYGFPLDSTQEILAEAGYKVDEEGFEKAMKEQREMARKARKTSNYMGADATVYEDMDPAVNSEFTGYDRLVDDGKIVALAELHSADEDEDNKVTEALTDGMTGAIITDKTPFYGTMGGQVGDHGKIFLYPDSVETEEHDAFGCDSHNDKALAVFKVDTTEHVAGSKIAMIGHVVKGMFKVGDTVTLKVCRKNRENICRNHSATHLLQKALRVVLGTHVEQAGSYQDGDRTRFDFSHFKAMTADEIKQVEELVNKEIQEGLDVRTDIMSLDEAKKTGAMALFGEKYGEEVRVVRMGDFSTELCGGTHVSNTREIGHFKIISESGVAAGVRRIEAITGRGLIKYYEDHDALLKEAAEKAKTSPDKLSERIAALQKEIRELNAENEKLKNELASNAAGDVLSEAADINGIKVLVISLPDLDMNELRSFADETCDRLGDSFVILMSAKGGKVSIVAKATDAALKKGAHAGDLIKETAGIVGGGGGGRPNMAQAGGKDASKIDEAIEKAKEIAASQIR
ncbi:MAG: alanine--tRNA ligase [Lachnospiraceae bacterium]|nr:alanine--tRNA ligase [Lachnospiraceae bacterium]MEE3460395.1 alanine--tRNA ligase [Lachnospiraceae bacterium]